MSDALHWPQTGLHLFYYDLPLLRPQHLKTGLLTSRQGVLLRWDTPSGRRWAEVAPFPGVSRESLGDCVRQMQAACQGLVREAWLPAVSWGLQQLHQPLCSRPGASPLELNALLTSPDVSTLRAEAEQRYREGYRCFKLKVGQGRLSDDLLRIEALLGLGDALRLRLDANRSWSLVETQTLMAALPPARIEYLEEPLADLSDYPALLANCPLPLALDESLLALEDWRSQMAVWVLKPMVLGAKSTLALMAQARALGVGVTLSSVFESGLGLRYLALLSQHLPEGRAAGLDTWRAWEADLWEPDFAPRGGQVNFLGNLFTLAPDLRLKWVRPIDDVTETM